MNEMHAGGFVRSRIEEPLPPPASSAGVAGWVRRNLFATPADAILTLAAAALLVWIVPGLFNFAIGHAVGPGGTVEECRTPGAGACWAYIHARFNFFIYGFYPADPAWVGMAEGQEGILTLAHQQWTQQTGLFAGLVAWLTDPRGLVGSLFGYWRVNLVFLVGGALLVPLLRPTVPNKGLNAALFFLVYPVFAFLLLNGFSLPGGAGLPHVPTEQWGGLTVTLVISVVGIVCSFPLAVLLALGRQSKLPIIKTLSVMFIELWRAVPLITVLFMASVMLPLFMPQGTTVDKLLRALVAVTLFEAAYLAEVIRGGLQALPRGQYEAAASLGLGYWKRMYLIILPQALKHVIPGIVNNFISLFKDTSLVSIVGIFDLLNTVQAASADADWFSPTQATTGYLFAAMMFWIFCFAMSRYSQFMERRLDRGHKR